MSDAGLLFTDRVAALRDAFDRSFAEARAPAPPASEDLLAVRIGAEPYALRLSEIAGLFAERRITPLPGSTPALLGIAGFRGTIVPVWDLAVLLGHEAEAVRWLAMAAAEPVAFALAAVDGHLRIALDAIVASTAGDGPQPHVRHFARLPGPMRPIVHLPSVLEAVRRLVATNLGPGED
ncbi:MAG TPA: chemotaxis protein CheW [Stellaceae bacterium]|jgi:purine-binding chemotaxis protein CheW|nr:chemotaxis protein CheW [Stellaceae bacterium]